MSSRHSLNLDGCWATTMLLGSGVGVLPFTINPVTPTGSTNCDTGTVTLHCFTFKDSHWQKTHWLSSFVWMPESLFYVICAAFICDFPQFSYLLSTLVKPRIPPFSAWCHTRLSPFISLMSWEEHLLLIYPPALHQFGFDQHRLAEK